MYASLVMQGDHLSALEVLQSVPHDAAAIFVYLVIGMFVFLIWYGSRRRA
jgi:hypothetical protein